MRSRMTISRLISHSDLEACIEPSILVIEAVAHIDRMIAGSGGDPKAADSRVKVYEGFLGDLTEINKEWWA